MVDKSLPQRSKPKRKKKRKLPLGVVARDGKWYVVVRYREGGKRHSAWRKCAKNPTNAKEVRVALKRELEDRGPQALKHSQMTWLQLSKHFREHYLVPAKFVDDRLVSGYRSIKPVIVSLNALDDFFGNKSIRTITHGDLRSYKRVRLETPVVIEKWESDGKKKHGRKVKTERQRSITSVNKELRTARHLFNIAADEGWLLKNPFKRNDRLISAADERKRERIVTPAEETLLLAACISRREHLRPRIILAIDTGMRWGEMSRIQVSNVDFDSGIITIKSRHTKTLTRRRVAMTPRVVQELRPLCANKKPTARVLEYDSVKTAWTGLRKAAGITDVRWHDLRHTNATRIEKSKRVSAGQLQRHLGHSDRRSTERYVNQDEETILEIAEVLQVEREQRETVH